MEEMTVFIDKPTCQQENKSTVQFGTERYCWDYFKEDAQFFCTNTFKLFYFLFGILQFFAIWDWLVEIFHGGNIFMALISALLAFLPLVGTVFGILATQSAWSWELSSCLVIFLIPYVIVNAPLFFIAVCEIYKDVRRWRAEGKI